MSVARCCGSVLALSAERARRSICASQAAPLRRAQLRAAIGHTEDSALIAAANRMPRTIAARTIREASWRTFFSNDRAGLSASRRTSCRRRAGIWTRSSPDAHWQYSMNGIGSRHRGHAVRRVSCECASAIGARVSRCAVIAHRSRASGVDAHCARAVESTDRGATRCQPAHRPSTRREQLYQTRLVVACRSGGIRGSQRTQLTGVSHGPFGPFSKIRPFE